MDIEDNEELENGGEGAVQDADSQEKEFRVVLQWIRKAILSMVWNWQKEAS